MHNVFFIVIIAVVSLPVVGYLLFLAFRKKADKDNAKSRKMLSAVTELKDETLKLLYELKNFLQLRFPEYEGLLLNEAASLENVPLNTLLKDQQLQEKVTLLKGDLQEALDSFKSLEKDYLSEKHLKLYFEKFKLNN